MEVLTWKLFSLVSLFVFVLVCGGLPLHLFKYFRTAARKEHSPSGKYYTGRSFFHLEQILGVLNSFAGGVFLATCMLDLLPEARKAIGEIHLESFQNYPLAELSVILGVVLLLIGEVSIERCTSSLVNHRDQSSSPASCDPYRSITTDDDDDDAAAVVGEESKPESPLMTPIPAETGEASSAENTTTSLLSFRLIALVIALSFHSIFDGLAIGLQTSLEPLVEVFIAISMHKSVFAFSLGVRLAEAGKSTSEPVFLYLLGFAVASPVGVAIGAMVQGYLAAGLQDGHAVSGILQSLAAGTLMYVTFFEILPEELRAKASFPRFVALFCGVGLVAFLTGYFAE